MTINFTLTEHDFLSLYMLLAEKNKRFQRQKYIRWGLYTLVFAVPVFLELKRQNIVMIAIFGTLTCLSLIGFPWYNNWRYKRYYRKAIADNFSKIMNQPKTLTIAQDGIHVSDVTGEYNIKPDSIEAAYETKEHFLMKMTSSQGIIIPKSYVDDPHLVKSELENIGIIIMDETDWKL